MEEWDPPDPRALTKLRSHPGDEISGSPLIPARRVGPRAPAFQVTTFIEITIFTKGAGLGVLTKTIKLGADGKPESDGSECKMASGKARRARIAGLDGLATVIESSQEDRGDRDRPDAAEARRQGDRRRRRDRRQEQRGNGQQGRRRLRHRDRADRDQLRLRTRPAGALPPRPRRKDDAADLAEKLTAAGGFSPALVGACPGFANAGRLVRNSTSAGLSRSDTGEKFPSSGSLHTYVLVRTAPTSSAFSPTSKGAAGSPVSVGSPSARPGATLSDQSSTSRSARRSGCASRPRPSSRRRSRRTRSPAVRSSIPATRSTASPSVHH